MKTLILLSMVSTAMSMPANYTAAVSVPLVSFDGNPGTSFTFTEHDVPHSWPDKPPVSKATWDVTDGYGVLNGEIDIEWNPSYDSATPAGWPGYIRATANGDFSNASTVSGGALVLMVRSSTPEYTGFRVSFGTTEQWKTTDEACSGTLGPNKNRGCYKASFMVPAGNEFVPVRIPFSSFGSLWLYGSGSIFKTCSEATGQWSCKDPSSKDCPCIQSQSLDRMKSIDFWAEGVKGKVHLEVKSIVASA